MIGLNIKEYVAQEKELIKQKIQEGKDNNVLITPPVLNIVQVGNVEASNRYVRNKVQDCEEVGIEAKVHHLPETITTYELASFVEDL